MNKRERAQARVATIRRLADGVLTIQQLADAAGMSRSGAKKILSRYPEIPRPPQAPPPGERNPAWVGGRAVGTDGYVIVGRSGQKEHRLVAEQTLGRSLSETEVVDHIDGLTLHNAPENLRVFPNNAEHLRATTRGPRRWSVEGRANIGARTDLGATCLPVDSYRQRREAGDVRLRQILLAWLKLDKDSPFLLGTHHWLEQAGIDPASRPSLERAFQALLARWGWDHDPLR